MTLAEAEIRVIQPADARTLRVTFIFKTFKLAKRNDFTETSVPGLNGEPLQFVRGHSRTLSAVLYFDGRATNTDVRQTMKQVTDLMNVDRNIHAPPVLSFEWTGFSLHCVLESSTVESFISLFPDGRPSRGRMHVTFRESLTLQELLQEAGRE
jgi:contractile injection system tube protein